MSSDLHHRIEASFSRQSLMRTFNAKLMQIEPGFVTISAPISSNALQQQGYAHAGLTFALGDSAAGYSALSLMPEGKEVVTAEIKINLLRPGVGTSLIAKGRVIKPGRSLVVVSSDVYAVGEDGTETHIATLQGTMVPVDL
jgi:uncharacterized protein (TIGR00369 family)